MPKKFDFISPGIQINEIDQSVLPADVVEAGPIIIGRAPKGPAMKPIRVNTLEDYLSIFGAPYAGGSSTGDVWREGAGSTAPSYAGYAAQSWLASQTTGITMVRLLGDEGDSISSGTKPGWKLSGSGATTSQATNSTAYGLFLINSSSANADQTGTLGAVFYVDSGYLAMIGTPASGGTVAANEGSGSMFFESSGDEYEFTMEIYNATDATAAETKVFNFNQNSDKYIRKVFNTNPILTTSGDTVKAGSKKTYWLGESFRRSVVSTVNSSSAGECFAVIAPLEREHGTLNWGDRQNSYKTARSGMVISDKETDQKDLFFVEMLLDGEGVQKDYLIAIEDLKPSNDPLITAYGSFTLKVLSMSGGVLESYKNLNLDENSPNFIARRIGDMKPKWIESQRRYVRDGGEYPNVSSYIRVEMSEEEYASDALPFGFKGPGRPKGFSIKDGQNQIQNLAGNADFTGSFVRNDADQPTGDGGDAEAWDGLSQASILLKFNFPSIPLRQNGTEGFPANPFKAYYGVRPKNSTTSNTNDPDYLDYLRGIPGDDHGQVWNVTDTTHYEYSFVFTLDDIVISGNTVTYTSGSYVGSSYTFSNGTKGIIDKNVKQFLMPVFGGFDGLDVTEKEPYNNNLLLPANTDTNSSLHYSINKAIDSVSDSEISLGNMMMIPGIYKPHITDKLIATCESRQDALALIDIENDYKSKYEENAEAADTDRKGDVASAISSLKNRNLNSSYAAAYYPWVQVKDTLNNNQYVWMPSSIAGLGAIASTEATSELWFAPAGFNRGGLGNLGGPAGPLVIQARQRLDSSQRDDLYQQGINPIASFPNEGVVIFGQKTLQKANSALDRINVRRLMIFLKQRVGEVAKTTLFQPNVQATWNSFKGRVDPILSDVQSRFGITEYRLILDETTTTPDLIDRNILYAKIYLKPARAIEFIAIDFVITKSGAELV